MKDEIGNKILSKAINIYYPASYREMTVGKEFSGAKIQDNGILISNAPIGTLYNISENDSPYFDVIPGLEVVDKSLKLVISNENGFNSDTTLQFSSAAAKDPDVFYDIVVFDDKRMVFSSLIDTDVNGDAFLKLSYILGTETTKAKKLYVYYQPIKLANDKKVALNTFGHLSIQQDGKSSFSDISVITGIWRPSATFTAESANQSCESFKQNENTWNYVRQNEDDLAKSYGTPVIFLHGWQTLADIMNYFTKFKDYSYDSGKGYFKALHDLSEGKDSFIANPGQCSWNNQIEELNLPSDRYTVYVIGYNSNNSIRTNSKFIANILNKFEKSPIVVAHSMGGMVVKQAEMDNPGLVSKIITLGTPHYGTTALRCSLTENGLCSKTEASKAVKDSIETGTKINLRIGSALAAALPIITRAQGTRDLAWRFPNQETITQPTTTCYGAMGNSYCITTQSSLTTNWLTNNAVDLITSDHPINYISHAAYGDDTKNGDGFMGFAYKILADAILSSTGDKSDGIVPVKSACLSKTTDKPDNSCSYTSIFNPTSRQSANHSQINGYSDIISKYIRTPYFIKARIKLTVDEKYDITKLLNTAGYSFSDFELKSSDDSKITIEGKYIIASRRTEESKPISLVAKIKTPDGSLQYTSLYIDIINNVITKISSNTETTIQEPITLTAYSTGTLNEIFNWEFAPNDGIEFKTTDRRSKNQIVAFSRPGKYIARATNTEGGNTATFEITVKEPDVQVIGIIDLICSPEKIIFPSETASCTATIRDFFGNDVTGDSVLAFTPNNPDIATINYRSGLVTPVRPSLTPATFNVTAQWNNSIKTVKSINSVIVAAPNNNPIIKTVEIKCSSIAQEPKVEVGQTLPLCAATVKDSNGKDVTSTSELKFESLDTSKATINPKTGEVTGQSVGTVQFTVTATWQGITEMSQASEVVTVILMSCIE